MFCRSKITGIRHGTLDLCHADVRSTVSSSRTHRLISNIDDQRLFASYNPKTGLDLICK